MLFRSGGVSDAAEASDVTSSRERREKAFMGDFCDTPATRPRLRRFAQSWRWDDVAAIILRVIPCCENLRFLPTDSGRPTESISEAVSRPAEVNPDPAAKTGRHGDADRLQSIALGENGPER